MWLCTQFGFYSIVQKKPGEWHVRARVQRDLENLCDLCAMKWQIHRTAPADYRWRLVVDEDDIALIYSCLSAAPNLDYDHFKSKIHGLPDQRAKYHAYSALWGDLLKLQKS